MTILVWTNVTRDKIPVNELSDEHLQSIIPFVYEGKGYDECISFALCETLYAEVEKRKLEVPIDKESFLREAKRRRKN